jgi:stage II sporulation protein D
VTAGERHQAYKGIATEYNTTHQAVGETAGEILSYKGGVVESLYAATQEVVDKAHNGVGMSQNGAYAYANQGYDYRQILGVYYPGVAIALLEEKR